MWDKNWVWYLSEEKPHATDLKLPFNGKLRKLVFLIIFFSFPICELTPRKAVLQSWKTHPFLLGQETNWRNRNIQTVRQMMPSQIGGPGILQAFLSPSSKASGATTVGERVEQNGLGGDPSWQFPRFWEIQISAQVSGKGLCCSIYIFKTYTLGRVSSIQEARQGWVPPMTNKPADDVWWELHGKPSALENRPQLHPLCHCHSRLLRL